MIKSLKVSLGFSLVEVLLVLMLVGAITAVIINLPLIINTIGSSSYESTAKEVAAKELETLRSTSYSSLSDKTITDPRLAKLPQGLGSVVIVNCPLSVCTIGEDAKQATVTVNWVDKSSVKKVEIVTLISQGGLQ